MLGTMSVKSAVTLIELLVVLTIIALLMSLLMPLLGVVRQAAYQTQCMASLRQVGLAITCYVEDQQGWYPTARQDGVAGAYGSQLHWFEQLTAYAEVGDSDRSGKVDRRDLQGKGRNVLKDCPTRPPITPIYHYGYGLNGCLRTPGSAFRSYWNTATDYYLDYREAQVTYPHDRALVGDSGDWHITIDNAKYPDNWSPTRHRGGSNYLLCDQRVAWQRPEQARLAISDPGKL